MQKKHFIRCALVALATALAGGCRLETRSGEASGGAAGAAGELGAGGGSGASRGLDPRDLPAVHGGPAAGEQADAVEALAVFPGPAQPVGIAVSRHGRIFVSYPRWQDPVKNTVVELDGEQAQAFPDEQTNAFDVTDPDRFDATEHFVSAQAIVFDEQDRLWVLDPGSVNFAAHLNGAPKLWAYDIDTRERVAAIAFPNDVALKLSALNDVRFDLQRGGQGTAYITDSGVGGIVIVDLESGRSWRHLDEHPSVLPTPGLKASTEGRPFVQEKPSGERAAPDFRSDGIALSPDGETLYYTAVMSHEVYSVPTALLLDPTTDEQALGDAVTVVTTKPSGNDGIACDALGRIYTTDFEDNSIRRIDPASGSVSVLVRDERFIWPDTVAFAGKDLYLTVNQLARQPGYRGGKDEREPPYVLFRLRGAAESK
jgi:sugar lactone lactonase YvrE